MADVVEVEAFGAEPGAAVEPAVGASVAATRSVGMLASVPAGINDD